ncbi:scarecrow-like protein 6 [Lolium rigidum]|uniref:scarecrow-like protein 6 n=1 Tax=Lolium rigidum TaxID=89674 RepID=UPI001F5D762A|nr:scarecrow-like protein 6 [Lolium rigidum]
MPIAGGAQQGTTTFHLRLHAHNLACAAIYSDPASVLDRRASPTASPPPATLSSSSPLAAAGVAALAKNVSPPPPAPAWPPPPSSAGDDWVHHLPPLDMAGWGDPHAAAMQDPPPPPSQQDSSFLRWIIGGADDDAAPADDDDAHPDLDLDRVMLPRHPPMMMGPGHGLPFTLAGQDAKDAAAPFRPHLQHQQPHTHAAFHGAFPSFDAHPAKRQQQQQHPMAGASSPKLPPFAGPGGFTASALKPKAEAPGPGDDAAAAAAVDQLAEAARLAEAGDAFGAREILARLNHHLPAAPAAGTPLLRSAFYFKEALRVALDATAASSSPSTPVDVLLKLGAYKAFSEVSPVLQFAHFTCVQAVLDELGAAACIHVLDFDIGVGEQWASLMQELAQRRPGAALKVTALVLPSSHHPLELQLIHENLSNFATELGVPFQFAVFNLDAVDPTELLAIAGGDAIAVHLPVGSVHAAAVPSVLHLVRRLGAKLVISVDRNCDRGELPFAAHLFQAFQSCVFLLESLDAVGTGSDVASKIERFLIQPKIESCVVRRHRAAIAGDKLLPWRTMFASAGFVPVQISTFAEAQADSLLKKVPVRGFRVEKRAGSLVLHWQRAELVSVSAWRC